MFADLESPLTESECRLIVRKANSIRPSVRLRAIRTARKLMHTNTTLNENLVNNGIISALVDCLIELEKYV